MINVLVLGNTGMLGSMVYRYLSLNKSLIVFGSSRNVSNQQGQNIFQVDVHNTTVVSLLKLVSIISPDYIINCIGIINKYCTIDNQKGIQNAILINSLFPHRLSSIVKRHSPDIKIIQIATDCVFSGNQGNSLKLIFMIR
jgi:dTDP-4-dehydrorhamnose reductase